MSTAPQNHHDDEAGERPAEIEWDLDADPAAERGDTSAQRLAELDARLADAEARALRAMADFQNFKRRSLGNEAEALRQGQTAVIASILPVLDHFELAIRQRDSGASAEQVLGGVELVQGELLRALERHGVGVIRPQPGDELDPGRHEAVSQMPVQGVEPGRIGVVFQVGYALGDRVLRPAKVVVAADPGA
jgi:molecular chaperone GrpE